MHFCFRFELAGVGHSAGPGGLRSLGHCVTGPGFRLPRQVLLQLLGVGLAHRAR